MKSFLFQVSNKLSQETNATHAGVTARCTLLVVLFHELRQVNTHAMEALMASMSLTAKAIKESLFEAAVRMSNIELLSELWEAGISLNTLAPLYIRFQLGHSGSIRRGEASIFRSVIMVTSTALQYAASTCDLRMAKFLISAGAQAEYGDSTPLQILCSRPAVSGTLEFAELLLQQGARWNAKFCDHFSPLSEAVACRNGDLVKFLIQRGFSDAVFEVRHKDGHSGPTPRHDFQLLPFCFTIRPSEDRLTVCGQIWEQKITALQLAILVEDDEIIKTLMEAVAKQDDSHEIFELGLITACLSGDEETVRSILHLDHRILLNQTLVNLAFSAIAWICDCKIAHLLIEHGATPCESAASSLSTLQLAALHGNSPFIRLLKSCGFDVDSGSVLQYESATKRIKSPWPSLRSPIACAVRMNHLEAAETLSELGADLNELDLEVIVKLGSAALVRKALLDYNNSDGSRTDELQRVLLSAAKSGAGLSIIQQLINAGARIQGHALVEAVRTCDHEVTGFLLSQSADVLARSPTGENVLEAAHRVGNFEMAQYYLRCGGKYSPKAFLFAANRALSTHDYHGIAALMNCRSPGPLDKYEASALVLAIRMNDAILIEKILADSVMGSPALSIYCWHGEVGDADLSRPLEYLDTEDEDLVIQKDYSSCPTGSDCSNYCSPMAIAALLERQDLVERMISLEYPPDAFLLSNIYRPGAIGKDIQDTLTAAFSTRTNTELFWHRHMLMASIGNSTGPRKVRQHISKSGSLDFCVHGYAPRSVPPETQIGPLQLAAQIGDIDCVKDVLQSGASVDWQSSSTAHTALGFSLSPEKLDIASILLKHGASIEPISAQIVRAAASGDLKVAEFLLSHGANINSVLSQRTALEEAASNGRIDMVSFLLAKGINIQDRERIRFVRAVSFARQGCHYATEELLKDEGGWSPDDIQLARQPRAVFDFHTCPRFVYNDPSLDGCDDCGFYMDLSSESEPSQADDDSDSTSILSMTGEDQAESVLPVVSIDNLLMLQHEWQDFETADWSVVPYTARDRELDETAGRMVEELFEHN